jgi:hypothetical protein
LRLFAVRLCYRRAEENGWVVIQDTAWEGYQGRQHGVPTPINDAVVRMIEEIEGGQRKKTPENLKDPVFANL